MSSEDSMRRTSGKGDSTNSTKSSLSHADLSIMKVQPETDGKEFVQSQDTFEEKTLQDFKKLPNLDFRGLSAKIIQEKIISQQSATFLSNKENQPEFAFLDSNTQSSDMFKNQEKETQGFSYEKGGFNPPAQDNEGSKDTDNQTNYERLSERILSSTCKNIYEFDQSEDKKSQQTRSGVQSEDKFEEEKELKNSREDQHLTFGALSPNSEQPEIGFLPHGYLKKDGKSLSSACRNIEKFVQAEDKRLVYSKDLEEEKGENGESSDNFKENGKDSGDLQGERNPSQAFRVKSSTSLIPSTIETESLFPLNRQDANQKVNLELRQKYKLWDDLVVVEKLGSGAFGDVHRVFAKTSREFFAKKQLKRKNNNFNDMAAKQENQALEKLLEANNPRLLKIVQLYYVQNTEFLALMEYGQGTLEDFSKFLNKKRIRWSDEDLLNLYFQICRQAKELNEIYLCHRDIKPANTIISNDGSFKLTDFGLAEVLKYKGIQEMRVAGTPAFWAPELARAARNRQRTCLLDPYKADLDSAEKTINAIMREDGRTDTICTLQKKYAGFVPTNRIETYESHKKEYRMDHFEKLYKDFTLKEKYENLHIFLEYYNFQEVRKWLNNKIKELNDMTTGSQAKNTDEEVGEIQLVYFLKAEIYHLDGKYDKARKYYEKCESMNSRKDDELAAFLANARGKLEVDNYCFEAATKYFQRSLDLKTHLYGDEDIEIAKEYYWLGLVQATMGDNKKALPFYEKALKIHLKNHNENSDAAIELYRNMGMAKGGLGKYEESINLLEKHLEQAKNLRGEIHPSVAVAYNNFGRIYTYLHKIEESLRCYHSSLEVYQKIFPSGHPKIVFVWSGMGAAYYVGKQKEKALECFQNCVDLVRKESPTSNDMVSLFVHHSYIFCYMYTIAEIYMDKKEYRKAKENLLLCIQGYEKILPEDKHKLGLQWVKWTYFIQKKMPTQSGFESYQKRIKSMEKNAGNNPELALFKRQLGLVYFYEKNYSESLSLFQEALNHLEKIQQHHSTEFALCLRHKGEVYRNLQAYEEAEKCISESLEVWQQSSII